MKWKRFAPTTRRRLKNGWWSVRTHRNKPYRSGNIYRNKRYILPEILARKVK